MSNPDHNFAAVVISARRAAAGDGTLSTGEHLVAALVLNRSDWLQAVGYTIAEAIQRVGPDWMAHVPAAAQQLRREQAALANAVRDASERELETSMFAGDTTIEQHFAAELITYSSAPGYRTPGLMFALRLIGNDRTYRAWLNLRREDGESIVRHIIDEHRWAWNRPEGPLDKQPGEKRPRWIDR